MDWTAGFSGSAAGSLPSFQKSETEEGSKTWLMREI